MPINLHFHIANVNVTTTDDKALKQLIEKVNSLNSKLDIMGANTEQALADLQSIKDSLTKIGAESSTLLQKVTDLETAAANTDTPSSVLDAIKAVRVQAEAVDNLVPDAPAQSETPVTEGPTP